MARPFAAWVLLALSALAAARVVVDITDAAHRPSWIPFGGTDYPVVGYVYANVPAFTLQSGDAIAFDTVAINSQVTSICRAISLATVDGTPACGSSHTVSDWTLAAPLQCAGRGNTVPGDYDLVFVADTPFMFAGGGLALAISAVGAPSDYSLTYNTVGSSCEEGSKHGVGRFFTHNTNLPNHVTGDTVGILSFKIVPSEARHAKNTTDKHGSRVARTAAPTTTTQQTAQCSSQTRPFVSNIADCESAIFINGGNFWVELNGDTVSTRVTCDWYVQQCRLPPILAATGPPSRRGAVTTTTKPAELYTTVDVSFELNADDDIIVNEPNLHGLVKLMSTTGEVTSNTSMICYPNFSVNINFQLFINVSITDSRNRDVGDACSSSGFGYHSLAAPLPTGFVAGTYNCGGKPSPPTVRGCGEPVNLDVKEGTLVTAPTKIYFLVEDDVDCTRRVLATNQTVFPYGSTPVSFIVTNSQGATTTCSFSVEVSDPFPPTLRCPFVSNISEPLVSTGTVYLPATSDSLTLDCVTSDSLSFNTSVCPNGYVFDLLNISGLSQSTTGPFSLGQNTITFTAINTIQSVQSCVLTLNVVDNTPPQTVCPSVNAAFLQSEATALQLTLTVSDNVDLASWSLSRGTSIIPNGALPFSGPYPNIDNATTKVSSGTFPEATQSSSFLRQVVFTQTGVYVFQFRAVDTSGNVGSCMFAIQVVNNQLSYSLLVAQQQGSSSNAVLSGTLFSLSQSAGAMNEFQASLAISVASSITSQQNLNSTVVFQTLDNLFTIPTAVLDSVQTASGGEDSLRASILALATALNGTSSRFQGSNLFIQSISSAAAVIPGFAATVPGSTSANFTLSGSAISRSSSNSTVTVTFTAFTDTRLFPTTTNVSVVTSIVDVTIIGGTLGGSLVFSMLPTNFSTTTPYQCSFYDITSHAWLSTGVTTTVTATGVQCTSVHLTNFAVLVDQSGTSASVLEYFSIVGCSLSIFGLACTICVHLGLPSLRSTVPSQLLINLCFALMCSLILFLLAAEDNSNFLRCRVWAIGMQYFWLASLAWMVVHGINLHAVIVTVLGLNMNRRRVLYYLAGWGLPAIIVGVTAGIGGGSVYGGGSSSLCWLSTRGALWGGFLGWLVAAVAINIVLFFIVIRALHSANSARRGNASKASGLEQKSFWREVKATLSIFVLLGVAWVSGALIDAAVSGIGATILQYIFVVTVTLQGFVIFLLMCVLHKQAREQISTALSSRTTRRTTEGASSSKNTIKSKSKVLNGKGESMGMHSKMELLSPKRAGATDSNTAHSIGETSISRAGTMDEPIDAGARSSLEHSVGATDVSIAVTDEIPAYAVAEGTSAGYATAEMNEYATDYAVSTGRRESFAEDPVVEDTVPPRLVHATLPAPYEYSEFDPRDRNASVISRSEV